MILASLACIGCDSKPKPQARLPSGSDREVLRVTVSIQPMTYFVTRIGGNHVDVRSILSPGQSHGAFDPSPKQVAALAQSKALFRIGVAFEGPLLRKAADVCPDLQIIDIRAGIPLLHLASHTLGPITPDGDHEHDHDDPNHICGEGELDPHIWLDPVLVKTLAATIRDALKRLAPGHGHDFDHNLSVFEADLDDLHARLTALLAPHRGRSVLVFHPSLGYFCERYGLEQIVIETEGKEPGPRRLGELIRTARQRGARVVFSQIEYSAAGAQAVAEAIGAKVVRLDPQSADWMSNLDSMAQSIAASFDDSPGVHRTDSTTTAE